MAANLTIPNNTASATTIETPKHSEGGLKTAHKPWAELALLAGGNVSREQVEAYRTSPGPKRALLELFEARANGTLVVPPEEARESLDTLFSQVLDRCGHPHASARRVFRSTAWRLPEAGAMPTRKDIEEYRAAGKSDPELIQKLEDRLSQTR